MEIPHKQTEERMTSNLVGKTRLAKLLNKDYNLGNQYGEYVFQVPEIERLYENFTLWCPEMQSAYVSILIN
jgi:deoxyadenosine/deoxycytidine kinase